MKNLLFILILFSTVFTSAQKEEIKKFHVGVLFSPEYSSRIIYDKGNDSKAIIAQLNEADKPIFGFQVGILFDYRIKRWIAIETGFKLAKRGFLNEFIVTDITGKEAGTLNYLFQNFYLELPIKTNFYFLNRSKVEMFASTAVTPGYLLQGKTFTEWNVAFMPNSTTQQKNEDIRNWNLSASTGIGIDISPIPNLGIRIETFVHHSIIPDYPGEEWSTYHFSFGSRIGLFFKF